MTEPYHLQPIGQVRNSSEVAADMIREAIFDGRIGAGRRMKEADLAREFGLSRTPIREALLVLQAEGLLSATPNRGSVVRTYSDEEIDDHYDLRALLESHAAGRAASRITEAQVLALQASVERYKQLADAQDATGLGKENLVFHFGVAEASGSRRLAEVIRSSIEQPMVFRSFHSFSEAEWTSSIDLHQQIVHALERRDAVQAQVTMRKHIVLGRDFWANRGDPDPAAEGVTATPRPARAA
jgi:DNA-binding GntR family transcriptional regulator